MTSSDFESYRPTLNPLRKVLLLEDDIHLGAFLREFLSRRAESVILVTNGADGVREILQSDFDIIVCDMMMPKLPGNMFYLAVERAKPHLCKKFIFITGNSSDPNIFEFIQRVQGVLLKKPFELTDLTRVIEEVRAKGT